MASTNTAVNNKKYGFNAEAELLEYLRGRWEFYNVERLHLTGKEDEGDLVCEDFEGHRYIVQLKTFTPRARDKTDRHLAPATINRWLRELDSQRGFYAQHRNEPFLPGGFLVIKTKGKSWDDALVVQRLGGFGI